MLECLSYYFCFYFFYWVVYVFYCLVEVYDWDGCVGELGNQVVGLLVVEGNILQVDLFCQIKDVCFDECVVCYVFWCQGQMIFKCEVLIFFVFFSGGFWSVEVWNVVELISFFEQYY